MEYLNNNFKGSDNIEKLPFFLNKSGSPASWFQLLETKFDFSAQSSTNKFYQTISCLPPDILKLLADDLVDASSSCNPYNYLKDLLTSHYKPKSCEIITNYFNKNFRVEMKPSEFLSKCIRDLESQQPGIIKENDELVRACFIKILAPDVQKIFNNISNIELCKLADFADKILDKPSNNKKSDITFDDKAIAALENEVIDLKIQIQMLHEKFDQLEQKINDKKIKPCTSQSSPSRKPVSRPQSPKFISDNNYIDFTDKSMKQSKNYCFYHEKYGSCAQKCQLGCTYQPKAFELKISNICIYHARTNSDCYQCIPGCKRYSSFKNGKIE